jgi:hypothetical protein
LVRVGSRCAILLKFFWQEFEYNKSKYHLRDVVIGKIYFILVRIKIKVREVSIVSSF